jgi:serine/threonine-protein kinase RsbW
MKLDPEIEASLKVIEVPSTLRDAKRPEEAILNEVAASGYSEDATFAIKLAIEEALVNAVRHGNQDDPGKKVTVRYCVTPEQTVVLVRDEGEGFEPNEVPDPTRPDRLTLPNGRGIMLMRAYLTDVQYSEDGREVCMIKRNE